MLLTDMAKKWVVANLQLILWQKRHGVEPKRNFRYGVLLCERYKKKPGDLARLVIGFKAESAQNDEWAMNFGKTMETSE
jgi:hypothetical protein